MKLSSCQLFCHVGFCAVLCCRICCMLPNSLFWNVLCSGMFFSEDLLHVLGCLLTVSILSIGSLHIQHNEQPCSNGSTDLDEVVVYDEEISECKCPMKLNSASISLKNWLWLHYLLLLL